MAVPFLEELVVHGKGRCFKRLVYFRGEKGHVCDCNLRRMRYNSRQEVVKLVFEHGSLGS